MHWVRWRTPTPEQYASFTNLVYNHVNQLTTEYGKLDLLFLDDTSQTKANVDYFGRDRLLEMRNLADGEQVVDFGFRRTCVVF